MDVSTSTFGIRERHLRTNERISRVSEERVQTRRRVSKGEGKKKKKKKKMIGRKIGKVTVSFTAMHDPLNIVSGSLERFINGWPAEIHFPVPYSRRQTARVPLLPHTSPSYVIRLLKYQSQHFTLCTAFRAGVAPILLSPSSLSGRGHQRCSSNQRS